MSQSLGSLYVDLFANVANFQEGMAKAAYVAQRTANDISKGFRELEHVAEQTFGAFGELNPIVSQLGFVLSRVGSAASGAMKEFGHLGGNVGALASLGAGAAVGLLTLEGIAIGLAIHTAEAAAKMFEMSQVTGVSVEALSGLGFVAKQSGVDADVMEKGLTKLNKSIFAAATATPGTVNAFTRLHIAVRDSNGELRGTEDVFRDVAERFAAMADGPAKGALAIAIFGKAGAGLIPILNEGREGIDGFLKTASALGIILDTETAEAAHKFEQSLNVISATGQGLALRLMRELLPALQSVTNALVEGLADKQSNLNKLVDSVVWLTKVTLALGNTFYAAFATLSGAVGAAMNDITNFSATLGVMIEKAGHGDFKGVADAAKDGLSLAKANVSQFNADTKKIWQDNSNFIENLFGPKAPYTKLPKRGGQFDVDAKAEKEDSTLERIKERIAALGREASEWLKIGQAGSQAEQLIGEAMKKGSDEFGKLRDMAAKEKNPATRASDLAFVTSNQQFIEGSAAAGIYGAAIKAIVSELDKQILKAQEETSTTDALTAAYNSGGIAAATISAHFADQSSKVRVLKDAHDLLAAKLGEENPQVKQLAEGYALAAKELDADKVAYAAKMHADLNLELAKSSVSLAGEIPLLAKQGEAYFNGSEAIRRATVALELYHYQQAHPLADDAQLKEQLAIIDRQSTAQETLRIQAEAAHYSISALRKKEIGDLENIRAVLVGNGESTLLINAKLYDSERTLVEQWDAAALKVGTYGQKFRAVMNQVILEGQNFGEKFFVAVGKAIDDLSTKLAQFVVTGKANFKEILQGFEQSVVKAGFQKLFATVVGKIPGLGGVAKRDGSSAAAALYVTMDGAGGAGGFFGSKKAGIPAGDGDGADGEGGGISSIFGNIFSKIKDTFSTVIGSITSVLSSIGSVIGRVFSSIGGIFGGFLAGGGDVTPGKAYVVGERHPEFFIPRQAGHVAPSLQVGGGAHRSTTVHMYIQGVTDFDSFKRSQGQILAGMQRQIAIAHSRNS